ncbi:hypothetical protein LX32DRAFT_437861 [Colletotrichum zoysiae]|uniref:Uncharacterized protein n=1 Tax=Colletotrichum zoysiae TaxID=1216348 RepID=A0AAD9M0B9_9PEZI|nr:hypothetical protein LX32DRAFT_437861 [Colletotrichum zoysiae]
MFRSYTPSRWFGHWHGLLLAFRNFSPPNLSVPPCHPSPPSPSPIPPSMDLLRPRPEVSMFFEPQLEGLVCELVIACSTWAPAGRCAASRPAKTVGKKYLQGHDQPRWSLLVFLVSPQVAS